MNEVNRSVCFTWKKISEVPTELDEPVIILTENNRIITFSYTRSRWGVCSYKGKYWIYQKELFKNIPKVEYHENIRRIESWRYILSHKLGGWSYFIN